MDCLDPYFHQRIAVLFISYSNESNNSPRPCISPWWVTRWDTWGLNFHSSVGSSTEILWLRSMIGRQKWRHLLNQSDVNRLVAWIFPRFRHTHTHIHTPSPPWPLIARKFLILSWCNTEHNILLSRLALSVIAMVCWLVSGPSLWSFTDEMISPLVDFSRFTASGTTPVS